MHSTSEVYSEQSTVITTNTATEIDASLLLEKIGLSSMNWWRVFEL
jgi:hypothetical protein